jgi:4-carboxymuconolactone decarboxylase
MIANDRMPEIPRQQMSAAQREAYDEIASGPRGGVYGPFIPLLRSPPLVRSLEKTGEYLRFESVLPQRLRELAILITARQWTQQFEWHHHFPIAAERGIQLATVQAIAEGRRPQNLTADEHLVYDFCYELRDSRGISDETYARALERFGERAIVELVVLLGYYSTMAMVMNVARTALPDGVRPPLAPFPP